MRLTKFHKAAALAALLLPLPGCYMAFAILSGNFHEVIPGELYRSAQPSGQELTDEVKRYGIKTVINLRGPSDDTVWYRDEVAATASAGAAHVDFRMSAYSELSPRKVAQLVEIMRSAAKPVLIHCLSGADRTGLAAALYLDRVAHAGNPEGQLSFRYGHLSVPFLSAAYAMDRTWQASRASQTPVFEASR